MNILQEIAEKTKERIAREKAQLPLEELRREAEQIAASQTNSAGQTGNCRGNGSDRGMPEDVARLGGHVSPFSQGEFSFERALAQEGVSFICEVKKASPSKGLIAPDFPYLEIAKDYERAGASAISCLTEPFYFQGQDRYLREIAQLGLSALVEAHDAEEVERALRADAKIVGVNNRDLRTFKVDIDNSLRLRRLVPPEILFVSESGIRTAEDIRNLRENGTDAVLIGETLMRSGEKERLLREWRNV